MKLGIVIAFLVVAAPASSAQAEAPASTGAAVATAESLLDARRGFATQLTRAGSAAPALAAPPVDFLTLVKFESPVGPLSAYLTAPPGPGKHPAIIWIEGGFPIGASGALQWEPQPFDNDASASDFRRAGIVTMFPTLRGSRGNPGRQESFFGEVEDVLAALEFLRQLEHIDRERIYLGGHSTGGTLALLVAASTDKFRGVFALGPAARASDYDESDLTFDVANPREDQLRSPIEFLHAVRSPTWVIEGLAGNFDAFVELRKANKNPRLTFALVQLADHVDHLASTNRLIARKIALAAPGAALSLTDTEIGLAYVEFWQAVRESEDLRTLARLRLEGVSFDKPQRFRHYASSHEREQLELAAADAVKNGFAQPEITEHAEDGETSYFVLVLSIEVRLKSLDAVFKASAAMETIAKIHGVQYDGWGA